MSVRALNTGLTGLTAARIGMDTASNNISNANTKGYTRQRVEFAPHLPTSLIVGEIGNGVKVVDIARTRDAFLDERVCAWVGRRVVDSGHRTGDRRA